MTTSSEARELIAELREEGAMFSAGRRADLIYRAADALESLLSVTETEQWEYGVRFGQGPDSVDPCSDRPEAERFLARYPDDYSSVDRRTPTIPAGPWLPVEEGTE